ncbi:GerMN domain-containing protein [Patescibacteria group bacterium]|nr:GerMN domain-containing protein [Patescibacteria group bacterium]
MKNLVSVVGLILLILGLAALVWLAQISWQAKTKIQTSSTPVVSTIQKLDSVTTTNIWATNPVSTSTDDKEEKTQTIEIFVFSSSSNLGDELTIECSEVIPLKRNIPWTGGDKLVYYQVVMAELLKGLTEQELNLGYVSYIPKRVELLSVIQAENGRYTADFSDSLNLITNPCTRRAIKSQVQSTLAHVPLQGKTLLGSMTINGQIINW